MRRVLRYEVPVDDEVHEIAAGPVLMATAWRQAPQGEAALRVELWVEATLPDNWPVTDGPQRMVRVFGTGHELPPDAMWLASCLDGSFVWHVYQTPFVPVLENPLPS